MAESSIYKTISEKTGGDIYIGVVGPVRTGKSTFIERFMENLVIPMIDDENERKRAKDAMPQGGSGKTITTTEPKFIPDDAVFINIDGAKLKVRLVDCVGYMVEGAVGSQDGEGQRMVSTPWRDEPIPFESAAEIGTKRVIGEHSTIAMLVTTDGSVCDIPRENYIPAEESAVRELRSIGRPFVIILNSKYPESEAARSLALSLEEKYGAPVALISCANLDRDDIAEILSLAVREFPIRELRFKPTPWALALPKGHPLRLKLTDAILSIAKSTRKIADLKRETLLPLGGEVNSIDSATGTAEINLPLDREDFFLAARELSNMDINDERELFSALACLSRAADEYDRIKDALTEVRHSGYGIVTPPLDELEVYPPTLVKVGSGYGVKIGTRAKSLHIIEAELKSEVCPAVGSEEQAREIVKKLTEQYEENPELLLQTELLGRSFYDMISDSMREKLSRLGTDARGKLCRTLERIVNDGANGLICILV